MHFMQRAIVFSRYGMGEGDPALSLSLMESYLKTSLEDKEVQSAYVFYNRGVCAALESPAMREIIEGLAQGGAAIYFCGRCLEYYGLAAKVSVGKIACMRDIRAVLSSHRSDFL